MTSIRLPLIPGLVLAAMAAGMTGCGTTQQRMNLSPESLLTPAHSMSPTDYPFDASGRYVDAWAAAGAHRYGSRVDTDHQDHGRDQRRQSTGSKPAQASSRPKAPPKSQAKTQTKATAKTASKPPTGKARTHTVKRGDTLSGLSQRYGVSVPSIKKANGLKSDLLRDGRKLVIPR